VECLLYIVDLQAEARISGMRMLGHFRSGDELEKNPITIESGYSISRNELKSQEVSVETNGFVQIRDVVKMQSK